MRKIKLLWNLGAAAPGPCCTAQIFQAAPRSSTISMVYVVRTAPERGPENGCSREPRQIKVIPADLIMSFSNDRSSQPPHLVGRGSSSLLSLRPDRTWVRALSSNPGACHLCCSRPRGCFCAYNLQWVGGAVGRVGTGRVQPMFACLQHKKTPLFPGNSHGNCPRLHPPTNMQTLHSIPNYIIDSIWECCLQIRVQTLNKHADIPNWELQTLQTEFPSRSQVNSQLHNRLESG